MPKKVKVEKYGMIHYYAQCRDCDWDIGIDMKDIGEQQVRNAIRSHVKGTGHTVTLESGSSADYSLVNT